MGLAGTRDILFHSGTVPGNPGQLVTLVPHLRLHVWASSFSTRIQLKVLTLIYHSHIDQAPSYLRDLIHLPSSAISLRPLHSLDRHDLIVPWARTSRAQTWAFAIIGLALWNQLPSSTWEKRHLAHQLIKWINWWAKCLFLLSQDFSLFSGSFALEALLNGVHCKKCYINE